MRGVLSALLGWHLCAVIVAALPSSAHTEPLRGPLREFVTPWLQATRTIQYWGMWAPDPRLDNPDLHIVVVDADGSRVEVDLHARAKQPRSKPSIAYDRAHKIKSTILSSGADGPYQRPLVRWVCRRSALQQGGRTPQRVELRATVTPIPPPYAPEIATVPRCHPR